jgi:hypothetical protein
VRTFCKSEPATKPVSYALDGSPEKAGSGGSILSLVTI